MANYNSSHTGAEIDSAIGRVKDTAVTAGTVAASSAVVVDANKDISGFRNVTLTGQIQAATINLTGDTTIGDGDSDNITINADVNSNIIPNTDNTFDLGSASKQWKDLYVNGIGYIDQLGTDADPIAIYASSGEIDGTAIGSESASTGAFTTLTASGDVNFDSNTLFVDASENEVMIGSTTSGRGKLSIVNTGYAVLALGTSSSSGSRGGAINFENETPATEGQILYDTDSDFMQFKTAGSPGLYIDSSQRVGIGTTSPDTRLTIAEARQGSESATILNQQILHLDDTTAWSSLHANKPSGGGINFSGVYNSSNAQVIFAGIRGLKENNTDGNYDGALVLGTIANGGNMSEKMRITSGGNVLVGKTSGTSGNLIETDGRISAGAGSDGQPTFNCEGDTNTGINLPESDRIQLITGGSEAIRIDSSQRVGIYTTSPNVGGYAAGRGVLTIGSTDNASLNNYAVLELQGHAIANDVTVGDISWLDHTNQHAIVRGGRDSSSTTGFLSFFTNGGSGVGERMRIKSDGELLLGGTRLDPEAGSNRRLFIRGSSTNYLAVGPYENNGYAYIESTGNSEGLYFYSSSDHIYDGAGNFSVRPYSDNEPDLGESSYRWQDIYATNGTIQTSDEREKENIKTSSLGLEFINKLNPVQYKWKDYDYVKKGKPHERENDETLTKSHQRTHYGLIAQEVEKVLTDSGLTTEDFAPIIYDEDADRYGMRYTELVGILIKGIQELSAQNDALTARIEALEA